MVPNPSQMQMLRSGLSTSGQASALITPSTSTAELDESGEEVTQCLSFDMKLSIGNYITVFHEQGLTSNALQNFEQLASCSGAACNR